MSKSSPACAKGLYYTMLRQAAKKQDRGHWRSYVTQGTPPQSSSRGRSRHSHCADKATILGHTDSAGIVNEFALLYDLRTSFPLHYIVFKQTASHLPHEGNSEQLFSRAGNLSDDNGKMDPARLGVWTSIGVNYANFQPSVKAIFERC